MLRSGAYSGPKLLGHQLEHRNRFTSVGEKRNVPDSARPQIGSEPLVRVSEFPVVNKRIAGVLAREQTIAVALGFADHQPRRVGVALEEGEIDRSVCSSSWSSAMNSPSVPGLMAIHSSAIAGSRCAPG